jgi:exodeoxyribonuclease-3
VKIATFNINNINRRLPNLLDWLQTAKPDVACLQELKCSDGEFPERAIASAGYRAAWLGQRTWNGVAILSRGAEPVVTRTALPGDKEDEEARYIEAAVNGIIVANIYLPNGNPQPGPKFDYKLAWLKRLQAHARTLLRAKAPVVLAGDYNVAPRSISIPPSHGTTTRWCSRKAVRNMRGWSSRAGPMRCGRCIPVNASTPTGITCACAGSAMPACASTICC